MTTPPNTANPIRNTVRMIRIPAQSVLKTIDKLRPSKRKNCCSRGGSNASRTTIKRKKQMIQKEPARKLAEPRDFLGSGSGTKRSRKGVGLVFVSAAPALTGEV